MTALRVNDKINFQYKYTIAMVNLNMENTIQQSILSIYNQHDENFEILVVDGGSSDKSVEKVKSLQFFKKSQINRI
jgi:glycosyltransferase involved in cell wall biosynthesis